MRYPVCAVGAVILDHGDILLVRRDREPDRNHWSLPGGRVELAESLREALAREIREETGIEADVDGLCGIAERIVRDDEGAVEFHYIIADFYATARSRSATAGDDAAEVRWFPVSDLAEQSLPPGLLEFLADRGILEGRRPRVPG